MDNEGQRIHGLAVQENVKLHQLRGFIALQFIIKGRISPCAGFERIEKVINYLVQRQDVMKVHPVLVEIFHILEGASPVLTELHYVAHKLRRSVDVSVDHGLLCSCYKGRLGIVGGVVDKDSGAVGKVDLVDNGGCRCYKVKVILTLQSLLDYLHMQQSKEAAPEPEAQRHRGLGLKGKRCVIKEKLLQRITKVGVLCAVGRIDTAVYHRVYFFIARERFVAGKFCICHCVAHTGITYVLDRSCDIADLTCVKLAHRDQVGSSHKAYLDCLELCSCGHKLYRISGFKVALLDTAVDYDSLVRVVIAVKDERFQRSIVVTLRSRDIRYNTLKHFFYIHAQLCRYPGSIERRDADNVLYLAAGSLGVSAGEVYLVHDRQHLEVVLYRKISVGKSLGFYSLGSINDKDSSLAGSKRT